MINTVDDKNIDIYGKGILTRKTIYKSTEYIRKNLITLLPKDNQ